MGCQRCSESQCLICRSDALWRIRVLARHQPVKKEMGRAGFVTDAVLNAAHGTTTAVGSVVGAVTPAMAGPSNQQHRVLTEPITTFGDVQLRERLAVYPCASWLYNVAKASESIAVKMLMEMNYEFRSWYARVLV